MDVHSNDPHWDWVDVIYTDVPPPEDVLSVVDSDGDTWSRDGDRWFVSWEPSRVGFGYMGETPNDLRILREWWEIVSYGPFTEAV